MKRTIIAVSLALAAGGQALAADLPPPAAPPPQAPATYVPTTAPAFSWSGFYLGINGGYAFGKSSWDGTTYSTGSFTTNGFLIGGTLGANYQVNSLVLGFEADGDYSSLKGSTAGPIGTGSCRTGIAAAAAAVNCQTAENWLATARGRVGFAFDRVLFYGTGGAAFGNLRPGLEGGSSDNITRVGWTGGGGVEVAFSPNWTAKIEYLYVDLGHATCSSNCGDYVGVPVSLTENLIRAGINYKF